ncbi:MAG: hemolysin III family protein [Treponemataceae bacterium]|nr:hemolysin III family protein [Treponemataceae bacterium]
MAEQIFEYEKSPQQKAADKIAEIKKKARADIKQVKADLHKELYGEDGSALDKIFKKKLRIQHKEAERIAYINRKKRYSTGEEIFHAISHGIGTGLAIAATVLMIVKAVTSASPELRPFFVSGVSVFGAALIFTYLFSTIYHALVPLGAKKVFAILDHTSIYVLIAGTYTPLCLGSLHNTLGWVYFGVIWALALGGVISYSVLGSKMRIAAAVTYLLMGWMIIFIIKYVKEALPVSSLVLLIVGGVVYTLGIFFYIRKDTKWMHSVWHLFSLGGSVLHFFAIYFSIK